MRQRLKNSARLVGLTALRAVAALAVLFSLTIGLGPMTGRYRTATVLTGSMAPAMPAGSMAVVVPTPTTKLEVGDVITYQAPTRGHPVVTHRIVAIREEGATRIVQTRGDANSSDDPWVAGIQDPTSWRRVAVIPLAGSVNRVLRTSPVHLALTYLVPLMLLVTFLSRIWSTQENAAEVLAEPIPRPVKVHLAASSVRMAGASVAAPLLWGTPASWVSPMVGRAINGPRTGPRRRVGRGTSAPANPRRDLAIGALALVAVPVLSVAVQRRRA